MSTLNNNIVSSSKPSRVDFADIMVAAVAGIAFAFVAVYLCVLPFSVDFAGVRDFVSYWATGQQLVHHADPYDSDAIMRIEHAVGLKEGVLLMRNPPWALVVAYPLGFTGVRVGALLWCLCLLGCLVISVDLIRAIHGSPENYLHWIGLSLPPAVICLIMGQSALLCLLGLALFLRFHRTRPFVAGMSLWFCTLKPHLFVPFAVVLLVWVACERSYRILAGCATAFGLSCAAGYLLYPSAWARYLQMMSAPEFHAQFIPCLSQAVRLWLLPQAVWLQYLPTALTCIWAVYHFWSRRGVWDWSQQGGIVILVSLVTAPYCYVYDQGLAVPALLQAAYATRSRPLLAILGIAGLVIEVEMRFFTVTSAFYLWTAPMWLAWYLLANARKTEERALAIA